MPRDPYKREATGRVVRRPCACGQMVAVMRDGALRTHRVKAQGAYGKSGALCDAALAVDEVAALRSALTEALDGWKYWREIKAEAVGDTIEADDKDLARQAELRKLVQP